MSGMGRAAADAMEQGVTRKHGHRTRWQARVERKDGRQVAETHADEHSRGIARMRRQGRLSEGEA